MRYSTRGAFGFPDTAVLLGAGPGATVFSLPDSFCVCFAFADSFCSTLELLDALTDFERVPGGILLVGGSVPLVVLASFDDTPGSVPLGDFDNFDEPEDAAVGCG